VNATVAFFYNFRSPEVAALVATSFVPLPQAPRMSEAITSEMRKPISYVKLIFSSGEGYLIFVLVKLRELTVN
jgi:hypothetical protein